MDGGNGVAILAGAEAVSARPSPDITGDACANSSKPGRSCPPVNSARHSAACWGFDNGRPALGHHGQDDPLEAFGNIGPQLPQPRDGHVAMGGHELGNFAEPRPGEGRAPQQKAVQRASEAVNVRADVGLLLPVLLGAM